MSARRSKPAIYNGPSLRLPNGRFAPGIGGGRPKGSRPQYKREITEFCRSVLESPAYRERLIKRLINGKAPHLEALAFYYAYGKPTETVKLEGEVTLNLRALLAEAKERARGQLAG